MYVLDDTEAVEDVNNTQNSGIYTFTSIATETKDDLRDLANYLSDILQPIYYLAVMVGAGFISFGFLNDK